MIRKSEKFEIPHGNGDVFHKIRLYSQECEATGKTSEYLKFEFILSIHNTPALSLPGGWPFERMELEHNGKCWTATFTALERKGMVI